MKLDRSAPRMSDATNGVRAHDRVGVWFAIAAAALFGASAPAAKALLGSVSPQLLAGLLYVGSGVGLALVWGWQRRSGRSVEAALALRDLPWLGGAIVFGGGLGPVLLLVGLSHATASSASLLLNLEGVFTASIAWVVFREHFDRRIALGMLAIVAGSVLLSWQGRVAWGGVVGPLAITAACACWAIDNNLTQRVSGGDPVQIAMLKGTIAGSVNVALALVLGATWPGAVPITETMLLGFVSYGVSLVLFVLALRHLGTARTGAYFSTAPFVGAALSIVFLREPLNQGLVAGGVLMGFGVWLHLTERHEHEHTHKATEHEHLHVHDEHHQHAHGPGDPAGEPHAHRHRHEPTVHRHPHYPDLHHRHVH